MSRLPHDQRKDSIIDAATMVFSEKGYYNTSIKDIAKAADISPALLYAYFDGKEDLYRSVLFSTEEQTNPIVKEMKKVGLGAKALVLLTFDSIASSLLYESTNSEKKKAFDKLFCRSIVGNNSYAKAHHEELERVLISDFTHACFAQAEQDGDLFPSETSVKTRVQFMLNMILSLKLVFCSDEPLYDYEMNRNELLEKATLFCLRGYGFTAKAIETHFNATELHEMIRRIHDYTN